jgi:hypothetical protein
MPLSNVEAANPPINRLPLELKELIWQHALPGYVPEVALLPSGLRPIIPLGPRPDDSAEHSLVIYTAYPVLMHVCREWRAFAMVRTTFRYSQAAMMDVPSRPFQPELDVLYIPAGESSPVWFSKDHRCSISRHIAMQAKTFLSYGARSLALMTYFKKMETLTIVLPSSRGRHSLDTTFSAPTTRCRLRCIGDPALNDLGTLSVVQDCGQRAGASDQVVKVSDLLQWTLMVVERMTQYLHATQEWDPTEKSEEERGAQTQPFKALAQTFIKYRYRNGSCEWTEFCGREVI